MPMKPPLGIGARGSDYGWDDPWELGSLGLSQEEYRLRQQGPPSEPVTTRPTPPTTAPQAAPAFVGPLQEGSQGDDWTPEDETYFRSLKDEVTGQPTTSTAESTGNGITAVKGPDGRTIFVTRNRIGGEGGYDPGSEIGYQAGLAALKRDPASDAAAVAALKQTTSFGPEPPKDITQLENFNDYVDAAEAGRFEDQLARARLGQAMQAAEVDPREMAGAELAERSARAHLLGAQGEEGLAGAEFTRARAQILQSPEAEAMKQGRANAETTLAFRARMEQQAASEIEPGMLDAAAKYMLKQGLAPDLPTALRVAKQRMIQTKVQEIIAQDPALQRYFIAQTGALGGVAAGL